MARSGHSAVILGTRVMLFGGFTRAGFLNDLHAFDTAPAALAVGAQHSFTSQLNLSRSFH